MADNDTPKIATSKTDTSTTKAREEQGNLIADRDLFLAKDGKTLVEENAPGAASQLVARGHALTREEAQRLKLSVRDGRVVQDAAMTVDDLRAKLKEFEGERDAHAEKIKQYREENATKDIPNTMEAVRVAIDARIDRARLDLSQAIKEAAGKDPFKGESQATALRPDLDTATPDNPAKKPAENASAPLPALPPTSTPSGTPTAGTTTTPPGRGE